MSKTIVGKVLSINLDTQVKYAPPKQGTYRGFQVVYQKDDGTVETLAKSIKTLEYQPALADVLKTISAGDDITIEMEKGEKFWELASIAKGANMPVNTPNEGAPKREYKTDKSGNWETAEERAAKQVYIVRQSSVSTAVEALGEGKKPADYIKFAREIEAYVFEKPETPEVE